MESLSIFKPDGTRLDALYAQPKPPFSYLVIICHGFSGAKENSGHLFSLVEKLNQNGFATLAFDFAGSGQSDGTFSSITLSRQIDDLKTVIDYAYEHFSVPLLLLGRSFGGSTVIGAGSDPRVAGCILWSAALYLEEVFRTGFGAYYDIMKNGAPIHATIINTPMDMEPSFVQDIEKQDMESYLKKLKNKPLFVMQGLSDTLVKPKNAELVRSICPQAEIHFIEEADHRFENLKPMREDMTLTWLKKNFPPVR